MMLVTTIDHSTDRHLVPSLLCYHCSDAVLATRPLPVVTMAYDPLLQWCAVVVYVRTFPPWLHHFLWRLDTERGEESGRSPEDSGRVAFSLHLEASG
jgi:hypothetical protein